MAHLCIKVDDERRGAIRSAAEQAGLTMTDWVNGAISRALAGQAMAGASDIARQVEAAAEANARAAERIDEASKNVSLVRRDLGRSYQACLASLMLQSWYLPVMLGLMGAEDGPAGYASEMSMEETYRMFWRSAGALRRDPAPGNLMSAYARLSEYLPNGDIEALTGMAEQEWRRATRPKGRSAGDKEDQDA